MSETGDIVLGIDLAQHCGWASVFVYDEAERREVEGGTYQWQKPFEGDIFGEVRDGGVLDLTRKEGSLYDGKMPNPVKMGRWMNEAYREILAVMNDMDARTSLVIVEVPDDFMFGYRRNKNGEMRKASDKKTIESMVRLSSVAFMAFQDSWLSNNGCQIECVSARQWQKEMFYGLSVNGMEEYIEKDGRATKALSIVAAWSHLQYDCVENDVTDAALMATWRTLHRRRMAQMPVQEAMDLRVRRKRK